MASRSAGWSWSPEWVRQRLIEMQAAIRDAVMAATREQGADALARVASENAGDTIYAIDLQVEELILAHCEIWAESHRFVLIAEGIGEGDEEGEVAFPRGSDPDQAEFRVIVDPIDGTRGIMYDKRSAWALAGAAPNLGPETSLADIVVAVQTELPTTKGYLADTLWAIQGQPSAGQRLNLLSGESRPLIPRPSQAPNLDHGFASLAEFFPGRRAITSDIQDRLAAAVGGMDHAERVRIFNDQYISSGGQLYEIMAGHARFVGDIRAHLRRAEHLPGPPPGLAAHPYDLCTELIARQAGAIVTSLDGEPLRYRLAVDEDVSFLAYANAALRALVEPPLQALLREYGLV